MIKVDLVTGFLGSGKTTFIRKYVKYLNEQGIKVGILENDYGAVNVDMLLLQDLRSDKCELDMIAGGCCFEYHQRRFRTRLISMWMMGYDRIIVEPSGIFDVEEFFDVLRDEPLDGWYEPGNVFAIVDAGLEKELSESSEYLLAVQTASAGKVILSRTTTATVSDMEETVAHINRSIEKLKGKRRFSLPSVDNGDRAVSGISAAGEIYPQAGRIETVMLRNKEQISDKNVVLAADWSGLTDVEMKVLTGIGYKLDSLTKLQVIRDNAYSSVYLLNLHISENELKEKASLLFGDASFGNVFRVKGFVPDEKGEWLQINATRREMRVEPSKYGQEVLIVIGEGLNETAIRALFPGALYAG